MKLKKSLVLIIALILVLFNINVFAAYDIIDLSAQSGYSEYNVVYNGYTYERMITYTGVKIPLGETVTLQFKQLENYSYLEGAIIDTTYFNLVSESGRSITVTPIKAGTSHIDFVYKRYTNQAQTAYAKCIARANITITDDLEITLTDTKRTMNINRTKVLEASITPYELYINNISTYGKLKWTSSNSNCVSISCNGKEILESGNTETLYTNLTDGAITLTSKEAGTAVITCELSLDSSVKATCVVTVVDPTKAVTGVSLNMTSVSLSTDGTQTLIATVKPLDATNQNVKWSSSDTDVVIVSGGKLYPQGVGTAVVTVTTDEGNYTASCTVTVYKESISVESITLSDTYDMIVGYTYPISAVIEPSNATNQNVIWESSNTDVAYIVNRTEYSKTAQVKAESLGTAILTATTEDGNKVAQCVVTVINEDSYTWDLDNDGVLLISGTGSMTDYETTSYIPWYSERLNITKIVISDGITSIGTKSFYGCINATLVEIPESVTTIGENAFKNCDEMQISGVNGSYAQEYAKTNNIQFIGYSVIEPLPDLTIELAENSSRWYFDITNDTYTENAIIYIGIYDSNNKLLAVGLENMVANDITSISITKVDEYSYAKIFEWVNLKPITNPYIKSLNE